MYCTTQDIIDRFGEEELISLTDREGSSVIDQDVLDRALGDAAAEIDVYIAAYQLPLKDLPPALVRVACDITRYHLYDDAATEAVQTRYDNALRFLRSVAKGEISLVKPTGETSEQDGDSVQYTTPPTVFGDSDLENF